PSPDVVTVADFNGDGILDLAVGNVGHFPDFLSTVEIFLGNGDGTFRAAQSAALASRPYAIAVGDFNRDGFADLAVAAGAGVDVLLGKGDGSFQAAGSYPAGSSPSSVAVGDFNGDGFPDLAVAAGDGVTVLLNAADWGGGPAQAPPGRS